MTTKPFFILSKSLRETLGHIGKKNGRQKNPQQMMKLGQTKMPPCSVRCLKSRYYYLAAFKKKRFKDLRIKLVIVFWIYVLISGNWIISEAQC